MTTPKLHTRSNFRHGIHPPDLKSLTNHKPIRRMPFPERVVLPLKQHTGTPAIPVVEVGDQVERGDLLARPSGWVSSPIHASGAGRVAAIRRWPHPDGKPQPAIILEIDPHNPQLPRPRVVPRWEELATEDIVEVIREAGIVGLGGAAFPTHVKLDPPEDVDIDCIIANGAECEPYLTGDHRTMTEYPERIHFGLRVMMKVLDVDRAIIGVEGNKPDAAERLRATVPQDLNITVEVLEAKYPQGAEKMMIKSLLDREVPSGGLPLDVGVVVQNVGSISTIAQAFDTGYPLIERIITVTGPGIREPANLNVPVGAPLEDVLAFCGGMTEEAYQIVFGGPMMGAAQSDLTVPILKGTTGVVVLTEETAISGPEYPCIRCGECVEACPVFLNPSALGKMARAGWYEQMADQNMADCMLCGSCTYVCPSNIPLVQLIAAAKNQFQRIRRNNQEDDT